MNEKELIKESVDQAVKSVFSQLGVDVTNPRQLEDFREELRFARKLHRASTHWIMAFLSVSAAGICAAAIEFFAFKFGGSK